MGVCEYGLYGMLSGQCQFVGSENNIQTICMR